MFRSTLYNISEKIKELSTCKGPQVHAQIEYTYCYQLNYCWKIISWIKTGCSCYFPSAVWTGRHCAESLHIQLEYSICCIHAFEKVFLFTKYSIMIIIKIYLWRSPHVCVKSIESPCHTVFPCRTYRNFLISGLC